MAAGDTLRRISSQDQLILDSSGNVVGLKNPNAGGADLRLDLSSVAASVPRRAAIIGNSIDAYGVETGGGSAFGSQTTAPYSFSCNGWFSWLQWLGGQRLSLDPTLNKATAGESSTQMLARFNTDIAANYNSFDILFMLSTDTNDLTTGVAKETTFANNIAMATAALNAGKWVVMGLTLPRGAWGGLTAPQIIAARKQQYWVNEKKRQWARTSGYARLVLVDATSDFIDPTSATGDPASSLMRADLLHPNAAPGMNYLAQRVLASISQIVPPLNNRGQGQADVYDATDNPLGNLLTNSGLTGTAGTITNTTGVVADNWILQRNSGTFLSTDCVGSKEAVAAAYGAQTTQRQVITFSTASGKTAAESCVLQSANINSGFAAGDRVYATCEMDISNMARMNHFRVGIQFSNSDTVKDGEAIFTDLMTITSTGNLLMRTPEYTIPAGTTFMRMQVFFYGDATSGTFSFTAKVGATSIRRVG